MTPEEAVQLIETTSPSTWFGSAPEQAFDKLRRLLHPDRFGRRAAWVARATEAIGRLTNEYSKRSVPITRPTVIGKWAITSPLAKGDVADLYRVESNDIKAVLKIAQTSKVNDLILREKEILTKLHAAPANHYQSYLPKLLESFSASGRTANVLGAADGFMPLSAIAKAHQLDFRHVVWMMNRGLSLLGGIHRMGVIHGALTADHLMYHPADHNLCLVDWCYSVDRESGKHISAISAKYRGEYPPEVFRKQVPQPSTDIYMLAKALEPVAIVPRAFRPLFELCTLASPLSRPDDAWAFQDKWKAVALKEYGPPNYVPLVVPAY